MSDDNRSSHILAVAVTFLSLTWIAVPLRIYVRTVMGRSLGLDDCLLIITQLLFTTYLSCQLGGWYWGTGRHRADLPPQNNVNALRFWFICEIFYVLTATFIKLAIGVFLIRIAVLPFHIWFLRVLMVGSVVFGSAYLLVVLLQCSPISTFWLEAPGTPGKCLESNPVAIATYVASVINCLADWSFGVLPIFIVWSLHMKKKTRIIVMCILGFASIGSTATLVRMFYVKDLLNGQDFLWATANFALWSTVELGIGIMATSIAALRPLLQIFMSKLGLSKLSREGYPSPSHDYVKRKQSTSHSMSRPASRLRPDDGTTSASIAGPRKPDPLPSKYSQHRISDDSGELGGITRTLEVSQSTGPIDGWRHGINYNSKSWTA